MKNHKQIISGALAAIMAMSMAACSGGANSTAGTTAAADTKAAATTAAQGETKAEASAETTAAGKDMSERIKVSWAEVIEGDEGTDYTQDAVYKYISDKYNIDIEIVPLTWGNWLENLRIWINSGDMPDVANWYYVHPEFMNYVDQGLVRKLNDDWKEKWPNTAKLYGMTGIGDELDTLVGGSYCLPVPIYFNNKPADVLTSHIQTYMRKDWVKDAGFEIKTHYTIDEFLNICRTIKEKDPGQVGENFHPIVSYSNMLVTGMIYQLYEHANPQSIFYRGEDGNYRWGGADEKTYETLKMVQDAYKEGLIHPEFYTLKQGEDEDMMTIAGTSACCWAGGLSANYNLFANEIKDNTKLNPDDALMSTFLTDNDGHYHSGETANYFGALLFNPNMKDNVFERVMDVIDFSVTEEGQRICHLGFEGTDYNIDSDGNLVALQEKQPGVLYPSIRFFQTLATRGDDFSIVIPSTPKAYRDKQKEQYDEKYGLTTPDTLANIDWTVQFHNSDAYSKVQFTYPDEYSQLIVKEGDLRANWEQWVKDKKALIDPVLAELNEKK